MTKCQQHHSDSPLVTRASAQLLALSLSLNHQRSPNSQAAHLQSSRSSAVRYHSRSSGSSHAVKGIRRIGAIDSLPSALAPSLRSTCSASISLFRCLASAWRRWCRTRRSSSLAYMPHSWGSARQAVPSRQSHSPSSDFSCSPRWWTRLPVPSTCRRAVTPPLGCSGASARRASTASTW